MRDEDLPSGVGKTALGVAMVRAEESRRSDRLFDDPYAAAFLAAAPKTFDREQQAAATGGGSMARWGAVFWSHAVIRTRFFDDFLLDAVDRGIRQIVLLAAGLDTRAYRFRWPTGACVFELDLPNVLSFKERVLAEHGATAKCERRALGVDLREDWRDVLIGAGLDRAKPTAWLAEGLLTYLSPDEAERLLRAVSDLSTPDSRLAFELDSLGSDAMRAEAYVLPGMKEYARLWRGGLPDAPNWMGQHGWRPEVHRHAEVAAGYGRPIEESTGGFVTAVRA
jgi:methyltransferase (TIGR00027 family)